jgi:hypothetical protein
LEVGVTRKLLIYLTTLVFIVCLIGPATAEQTVDLQAQNTGATLVYQNQNEINLRVEIASISFENFSTPDGDFVGIGIESFARSQKVGEPNLPMLNKIISIPFGCELQTRVVSYDVEEINLDDYNLSAPVYPVQPSLSKSQDPSEVEFQYNRQVYQETGYYSLPLTESSYIGVMRALNLGMISIAPVQYDAVANKIRVYNNLTVSIEFVNPDWQTTSEMRRKYYSPFFEPVYNKIINYEPLPPTILNDLVKYPVKYVIISDRMFEAQLQPFIEWKTQKGFNVITAYTDDIGFSNTAIKTYIQDLYDNSNPPVDQPPSFVLLVGDDQQIEAFSGTSGSHISDLYFCEFQALTLITPLHMVMGKLTTA